MPRSSSYDIDGKNGDLRYWTNCSGDQRDSGRDFRNENTWSEELMNNFLNCGNTQWMFSPFGGVEFFEVRARSDTSQITGCRAAAVRRWTGSRILIAFAPACFEPALLLKRIASITVSMSFSKV